MSQSAAAASGWEILTVKGVYQSKLAAPATVLYNVVLRGEYQKDIWYIFVLRSAEWRYISEWQSQYSWLAITLSLGTGKCLKEHIDLWSWQSGLVAVGWRGRAGGGSVRHRQRRAVLGSCLYLAVVSRRLSGYTTVSSPATANCHTQIHSENVVKI